MSCYTQTSTCSTCSTCYQPQTICSCPTPAPVCPPAKTCKSPFDFFFGEILSCYLDQPCQNTNCTSPLVYAINTAFAQASSPAIGDVITAYNTLMDAGLVTSNTGNKPLCCPGCCGDIVYLLGKPLNFTTVQTAINSAPNCCVNSKLSAIASTNINNFFKNKNWNTPVKCDNNFEACINLLFSKVDNAPQLLTDGIIELPSAGLKTEICNLVNTLTAITPALTATDIGSFVDNLLSKGFVSSCGNGQIFIGSSDTFITWYNANS